MIDFELAAKKGFEAVFPNIVIKGCIFHFGQRLFKKFCALGLKQDYLTNTDVQVLVQKYFLTRFNSDK